MPDERGNKATTTMTVIWRCLWLSKKKTFVTFPLCCHQHLICSAIKTLFLQQHFQKHNSWETVLTHKVEQTATAVSSKT